MVPGKRRAVLGTGTVALDQHLLLVDRGAAEVRA
jgi:hypothetical protein